MRHLSRFGGRRRWLAAGSLGLAALAVTVLFVASSSAAFHGITVQKSCDDPVKLTESYTCAYRVINSDPDTVRIVSYKDEVTSPPANPAKSSGEIMPSLSLVVTSGTATCNGSGSGTSLNPYVNSTECILQPGAVVDSQPFSFYQPNGADYLATAPGHQLTDVVTVGFFDTCNNSPTGCNSVNQASNQGAAAATMLPLVSSTATTIHNAAHQA